MLLPITTLSDMARTSVMALDGMTNLPKFQRSRRILGVEGRLLPAIGKEDIGERREDDRIHIHGDDDRPVIVQDRGCGERDDRLYDEGDELERAHERDAALPVSDDERGRAQAVDEEDEGGRRDPGLQLRFVEGRGERTGKGEHDSAEGRIAHKAHRPYDVQEMKPVSLARADDEGVEPHVGDHHEEILHGHDDPDRAEGLGREQAREQEIARDTDDIRHGVRADERRHAIVRGELAQGGDFPVGPGAHAQLTGFRRAPAPQGRDRPAGPALARPSLRPPARERRR